MKNKKFLKIAGVLLLAVTTLLTSITVTANTNDGNVAIAAKNGTHYSTVTPFPVASQATSDTFTEGFEGGIIPAGWQNIDYDGDSYIWQAAIAPANPAHTGSYSAMSESYVNPPGPGAITPDNWLITPALTVTAASDLSFWVAAQDPDWAQEHIEVWVSTSGTSVPSSFTTQIDGYTCSSDVYVERVVDLASYASQTIYLAFRHCETTDMFQIKIDDVTVTNIGTAPEDITPPVTTCALAGTLAGSIYTSDVTVSLSATDDSSGVNYTMYKLDDGSWTTYTAPFVVTADGAHTVLFYSADVAGNIETEKNSSFTIQHALPITITIKGGLGVSAVVKNTGAVALNNISYTIDLNGGVILLGKTKTGTIATLGAGEEVTVKDFVFGFGKSVITVTAGDIEQNANSTVLLFFIIGVA
jgi:hypothetical protein